MDYQTNIPYISNNQEWIPNPVYKGQVEHSSQCSKSSQYECVEARLLAMEKGVHFLMHSHKSINDLLHQFLEIQVAKSTSTTPRSPSTSNSMSQVESTKNQNTNYKI